MTVFLAFLFFFGESALWFGLGGLVLSVFLETSNLAFTVPLFALGALLAEYLGGKRKNLRFLGMIPGVLTLTLCQTPEDLLLILPMLLFFLISVLRGKLCPAQTEVYYRFQPIAAIAAVGSFLAVLAELNWCYFCCMGGLIVYLFVMRLIRHDLSDFRDRRVLTLELGLLLAMCLLGLLLSRKFMLTAAWNLVKIFYYGVIYPILMLILHILALIGKFLSWLISLIPSVPYEMIPEENVQEFLNDASQVMGPGELGEGSRLTAVVIKAVEITVFLALSFLAFRYFYKSASHKPEKSEGTDAQIPAAEPLRQEAFAPPSFFDRSPEAAVRRAYGNYCRWVERNKCRLGPDDTTRSVNVLAELAQDERALQLRGLYLRARYCSRSGLTREEARKAAALSRELTKPKKSE